MTPIASAPSRLLLLSAILALASCGGSEEPEEQKPGATTNPPQTYTAQGTVAIGAFVPGAKVKAYGGTGVLCGQTTTNGSGAYALTVNCGAPLLLVAEASSADGDSLFGVIPGSGTGAGRLNLTPISTAVASLVIGDHAINARDKFGAYKSRMTAANVEASVRLIAQMLEGPIKAFSAEAESLQGAVLRQGQGLDAILDVTDIQVRSEGDLHRLSISAKLPTRPRPVILRNSIGALPGSSYFDTAFGEDPANVVPAEVTASQQAYQEIRAVLSAPMPAAPIDPLIDTNCFVHDGTTNAAGFITRNPDGIPVTTKLKVRRFNIFTDFQDEQRDVGYNTSGSLALVSYEQINVRGLKETVFTWMVKGDYSTAACTTSATDWKLLGNQHQIKIDANAYALSRTTYGASLNDRTFTFGTGLDFDVQLRGLAAAKYVVLTGPALPDAGLILVDRGDGVFLKYPGTLANLRKPQDAAVIYKALSDTAAVALTDMSILPGSGRSGIANYPYDDANTYVFRLYSEFTDITPLYIYTDILPKRPYLNTELPSGYFPILAVDRDDVVAAADSFAPLDMAWDTKNDLRDIPFQAQVAWIRRYADVMEGTKIIKQKTFVMPGSLAYLNATDTGVTVSPTYEAGTVTEAFACYQSIDSYGRLMRVELGFKLK